MKLSGRPIEIAGNKVTFILDEPLNIERIETMYEKPVKEVSFWVEAPDPRHATSAQQRFCFKLIGFISKYTGQPVLDIYDYFKLIYAERTCLLFSFKKIAETTVTEASFMADLILDFIFEFNIPFENGFEIIPQNMNRYLYNCIKKRQCAICRDHAEIHHHENLVGIGRNRNQIDNAQSCYIALCRKHHNECHQIGLKNFANKHHLVAIKVDEGTLKRIGLRVVAKDEEIEVEEIENG